MAVIVYTQRICAYCVNAKRLLDSLDVAFQEVSVDGDPELRMQIAQKSGQRTVPQIWVGDVHVGGFNELYALHKQNKLMPLIVEHGGD